MTEPTAIDELARFDAAVESAWQRRRAARERHRGEFAFSVDATADLTRYRNAVIHRQRSADPAEARRLTSELGQRIQSDGLVFETMGTGGALMVRDPAVAAEVDSASADLASAKRARADFLRLRGNEVVAERKREAMKGLRDALAGDDPDRLREALPIR